MTVACSRPEDSEGPGPSPGCDLVAFASPRRTLWGEGRALVIDVPGPWSDNLALVDETLGRIAVEGGRPPVAFGALPYDSGRPAHFIVPAVLHGRTAEGDRWLTTIEPSAGEQPTAEPAAASGPGRHRGERPTTVSVRSVVPAEKWCAAVADARDRIRAGELAKVVLAREIEVHADAPFEAAELWAILGAAHPGALRFAVEDFVGASPELLVSRSGDTVRAHPMAGTTARTGDPEGDQRRAGELLADAKNRAEHQITIDAVRDALLGWCSYLDDEPAPSVVAAGPVQHLATLVEGRLGSPRPSVLDLVAALHPTPAVGGSPRAEALALQTELEGADRGRYAGPVGWVDATGDGAFAVGIRSVQLAGPTARLFAGVGVVGDSDPATELAETRAKAQALLSALVRV